MLPPLSLRVVQQCLDHHQMIVKFKLGRALPDERVCLSSDSRLLSEQSIFVAIKGQRFDGHDHIEAAAKICKGLIVEDGVRVPRHFGGYVWLVEDSRKAYAYLCAQAYENPQDSFVLAAVTGTNGKTSTVWFIRELLRTQNILSLSAGTLGIWIGDDFLEGTHTTPNPDVLFRSLAAAKARGIRYAEMEVTSHALTQDRFGPVQFNTAAFTSFSRDHLDYHKDMADYFQAKMKLFNECMKPGAEVAFSSSITELQSALLPPNLSTLFYGKDAHVSYEVVQMNQRGMHLRVRKGLKHLIEGWAPVFAPYAAENFIAALLLTENMTGRLVAPEFWSQISGVPGRLERVQAEIPKDDHPLVLVDYAHTPDALFHVLKTTRVLSNGNIWVVFGCGGDRDAGKRPQMGKIASDYADRIVITNDNPRFESPEHILTEIEGGVTDRSKLLYRDPNRKSAIQFAIQRAKAHDVVLICGKGHENYMDIMGKKEFFDDRLEAKAALSSL